MFRTGIGLSPSAFRITHKQPIVTIGSCFSDVMGRQLAGHKFNTLINPYGTVYNPASIFKLLHITLHRQPFNADGVIYSQDIFYHYYLHSSFGAESEAALLTRANQALEKAASGLQSAGWLLITLGTAVVYTLRESGNPVANCHKAPAAGFTKKLMTVKEVIQGYEQLRQLFLDTNPGLKVLFTLSPVRHIKDTLTVNGHSKAVLRVAIAEIVRSFSETHYFPSYEIMTDDLRDYRFYKKDMIHPNKTANEYIWKCFSEVYFDEKTREILKHWVKVKKNLSHKPFHPQSASHYKFLKNTLGQLEQLSGSLDVSSEIATIKAQLP